MTDLAKLIERVEAATGPDRALDKSLAFCTEFRPEQANMRESFDLHEGKHDYATAWIAHQPWHNEFGIPEYTASIDASLGLVERVLPGTLWATGSMEEGPFCQLVVPNGRGDYIGGDVRANAATPPLAILLALLRALSARSP